MSKIVKAIIKIAAALTVFFFVFIVGYILINGIPSFQKELFIWDESPGSISLLPSLMTTLIVVALTIVLATPIGVITGIYLVEYADTETKLIQIIRLATVTLAGVPSIVFGLFGYLFFVVRLGWSYSVLSGVLTGVIMVLPLIIRSTEEALIAVDDSIRHGSFALGAGQLATIRKVVLPSAVRGILAGVILAIGRVVGETAALMYTLGTTGFFPRGLLNSGRTLALHMYILAEEGFHVDASNATAVVLLVFVLAINRVSTFVSSRITGGQTNE